MPLAALLLAVAADFRADLDLALQQLRALHPELERRHARAEWDAAAEELRGRLDGISPARFAVELSRLVALAGDGHTRVEVERSPAWRTTLPLRFRRFADGLFVVAAAPDHAALAGQRVDRIGARAIETLLLDARPWLSADHEGMADAFAPLLLITRDGLEALGAGPATGPIEIATVDGEGRATTTRLATTVAGGDPFLPPAGWSVAAPRVAALPPSLRPNARAKPTWFEWLDGEPALYVRIDAIADDPAEPFAAFVARLFAFVEENEIERLVLDLRGNDGGDNYLAQPLVHALLRCDRINRPGHLFVLTGPLTFSAAVNCVSDLERETQALFVGEPTGAGPNHCGDPTPFTLPASGLVVRCSTVRWQKSDPRDRRRAHFPDVAVAATFADWSAGHDAALEAALAFDPADAAGLAKIAPVSHWRRPSQSRGR
jgi:hypothetical protein